MKLVSIQPITRDRIENGCSFYTKQPSIVVNVDYISSIEPYGIDCTRLIHVIDDQEIQISLIRFSTKSHLCQTLVQGSVLEVRELLTK